VLVLRLDQQHAGPSRLRFRRRDFIGWHEAGVEPIAGVGNVRLRARGALFEDGRRGAGGDDSPERAGDLELQVGARHGDLRRHRRRLRACRALERVAATAGVNRPLQIETRPVVVRDVRIQHARDAGRSRHRELDNVVRARVGRRRRHDRQIGRGARHDDRLRGSLARPRFGQAVTRLQRARLRFVQRQLQRRRLLRDGCAWRREGDPQEQQRQAVNHDWPPWPPKDGR
jgi:hypothetical protein